MQAETPSRTAYRVALRRAAHQVFDDPVIFRDPFALPLLGLSEDQLGPTDLRAPNRPGSRSLRAFLVARSLFAEESLARLVDERDVSQYVLLGAGLDTFALRNGSPQVRVFEVDHMATQRWKNGLLIEAGLSLPSNCTQVAVDFEEDSLQGCLADAGLQPDEPALFAMLGVVPYLTEAAFAATLAVLGARRAETWLVLDYSLPRALLPPTEQLAFDSLAQRVRHAGEPFQLFLSSEAMAQQLGTAGFRVEEDLAPQAINERYFAARGSTLRVRGSGARLLLASRSQAAWRHRASSAR